MSRKVKYSSRYLSLDSNGLKSKEVKEYLLLLNDNKDKEYVVESTYYSLPASMQTFRNFINLFAVARRFDMSTDLKRRGNLFYEKGKIIYGEV